MRPYRSYKSDSACGSWARSLSSSRPSLSSVSPARAGKNKSIVLVIIRAWSVEYEPSFCAYLSLFDPSTDINGNFIHCGGGKTLAAQEKFLSQTHAAPVRDAFMPRPLRFRDREGRRQACGLGR